MRTVKDIEAYLGRMNRPFEAVAGQEGTFLVRTSGQMPPIAIRVDAPLVVFRVHIGDAPKSESAQVGLFKRLLELNAKTLVHTSFGLEDQRIVLCNALELENLDFNELEATLDEFDLTLGQQVSGLAELSKK
jgi:hypothetical protein